MPVGQDDKTPLSVTLKGPITVQKSDHDRDDDREKSNDQASNERWLIFWTAGLVVVTFGLVIITGVLARYTYKLWLETDLSSKRQAKQFENVQRPYVYVYNVKGLQQPNNAHPRQYLSYKVANHGVTPAVLEPPYVGIFTSLSAEPNDTPLQAAEPDDLVVSPILAPREDRWSSEQVPDNMPIPSNNEGPEMFFKIIIHYSGPFTNRHITVATWRFNPASKSFIQFGGDAYNYRK